MHKGILILNFIIGLAAVAGLGYLIWRVNEDLLGIPTPAVQDMTTSPAPTPQAPPAGSVPFAPGAPEAAAESTPSSPHDRTETTETSGASHSTSTIPPLTAQDGAVLFKRHCASCHGEDGKGQSYVAHSEGMPSVADLTQLPQRDEQTIRTSIRQGKGSMPAFGGRISEAALEALYLHLIPIINAGQAQH